MFHTSLKQGMFIEKVTFVKDVEKYNFSNKAVGFFWTPGNE